MDGFVDRQADLRRLEDCFSHKEDNDPQRKIVILHGPAGIGKSRLSAEFVRLHQHKYHYVFLLNGKSEVTLRKSIASIASRIPAEESHLVERPHHESPVKVETDYEKALQWLATDENGSWLLIFDDVRRDTNIVPTNEKEFDVEPYLPRASHGHVLMTTRLSRFVKHGRIVELNLLDDHESMTLLAGSLETSFEDTADMAELVKLVGGNPLAILQAASFIRKTSLSIADYVTLFNSTMDNLMEQNKVGFSQKDCAEMCIFTTWTIAYEKIKKNNETITNFLKLWAFLGNSHIWFDMFSPEFPLPMEADSLIWFKELVSNKQRFNEVLAGLQDYSMIETVDTSGAYSMPALFHDFASRTIRNQDKNEFAWLAVVIIGRVYEPKTHWKNLSLQHRLMPHADCCYQWIVDGSAEAYFKGPSPSVAKGVRLVSALIYSSAIYKMGKLYHDQDKLIEAKILIRRVVEGYGDMLGEENPATLDASDVLATICAQEGNITEAREIYLTVIEHRKKSPDIDRTAILETFRKLGAIHAEQHEMTEAEKMYRLALNGYHEMGFPGHPLSLLVVAQLGEIYESQGRLVEAEEVYLRTLASSNRTERMEHLILLDAISRLATLYITQKELARAEKLYLNAQEGYTALLGPEHKVTLATTGKLGSTYKAQEKFAQAEEMYHQALQGYENTLGPDNPSTLKVANELIGVYSSQEKRDKSQAMVRFVLRGIENSRGPDHESTIHFVTVLGVLCSLQGQLEEAEELLLRALPVLERNKSPKYETVLKSVHNLAIMYKQNGRFVEAERTALTVLQAYEKTLGSYHQDTLDTAAMIGYLCKQRDDFVQAERFLLQALRGYDQILGEEHESTLDLTASLADIYEGQDKFAAAENMLLRALRGYNHKLGSDHADTANAAYNLATVYTVQGNFVEAEKMYRQATDVYMAKLGSNHTFTTDAIYNLASVLHQNGKLAEAEHLLVGSLKDKDNAEKTSDVSVCDAMMNLGTVYLGQGKLTEAEDTYLRALKGYEKSPVPNNTGTLNALYQLGGLHVRQDKLSEAKVRYLRALTGYGILLGSDTMPRCSRGGEPESSSSTEEQSASRVRRFVRISGEGQLSSEGPELDYKLTVNALRDLISLYFERRELDEAESLCCRLLEETEKALGSDDSCTIETANLLSSVLLDQCRGSYIKEDVGRIIDNTGNEVDDLPSQKSIHQLTRLSENYGKSNTTIYGRLGRALRHLGDSVNAVAAFECQHSLNKTGSIICDHCTNSLISGTGRYVCETCRDADLCEACWSSWLDGKWQSMTCKDHNYFRVFPATKSSDERGAAGNAFSLASWMQNRERMCEDEKAETVQDDAGVD